MAHYFVHDDANGNGTVENGEVYLVAMSATYGSGGSFTYYSWDDADSNDRVDDGELTDITGTGLIPASVIPKDSNGNPLSYNAVRQNFANWYSFYRRRELAAKAAIGQVIDQMEEVKIGMAVINNRSTYNHPVQPVKLNGVGDSTETLLNWLYAINSNGGTPLTSGTPGCGAVF